MQNHDVSRSFVNTDDSTFERALNEIGDRIREGEIVDVDSYCRQLPEFADRLRKAIPGIQAMLNLGHNTALRNDDSSSERFVGQLGDYRIVREIGRGGMGIVYEAEQISLGRTVALKVLPFATMLDERHLQRFKNEARAAATLDHPQIVPVYGIGQERGVHYYAMRLVKGQSLAELISDLQQTGSHNSATGSPKVSKTLPPIDAPLEPPAVHWAPALPGTRESALATATTRTMAQYDIVTVRSHDFRQCYRSVARLGIQAAEALDHAHSQGILHRDVKPANLLLDELGRLFVTDFGLARIESNAGVTMTGDVLGTIRYMSPEQTRAQRSIVDHRSDIYSLGITLYELVTLRPAFEGNDRQRLLQQIAFEDPLSPKTIARHLPADLDTIIRKAIEKNPADRYATAQEMADDLRRFVDHRPIVARPPGPFLRAAKWSRRNRATAVAVASVICAVALSGSISTLLLLHAYRRVTRERATATAERSRADANLLLARETINNIYVAEVERIDEHNGLMGISQRQRDLLQEAVSFYEDLPATERDSVAVRRERARVHSMLGRVLLHLGRSDEAREALNLCVPMQRQILQATAAALDREALYQSLLVYARTLEGNAAVAAERECLALCRDIYGDATADEASLRTRVGNALRVAGHLDESEGECQAAIRIYSQLLKKDPSRRNLLGISLAHNNYAEMLLDAKRYREALSECETGKALLSDSGGGLLPTEAIEGARLRLCYTAGFAHFSLDDLRRGTEEMRQVVSLAEKRLESAPVDWETFTRCDKAYFTLYHVSIEATELDEAILIAQKAVEMSEKIEPILPNHRNHFWYEKLGDAYRQTANYVEMKRAFEKVLEERFGEYEDTEYPRETIVDVVRAKTRIAGCLAAEGDVRRANSMREECVGLLMRFCDDPRTTREEKLSANQRLFSIGISCLGYRNPSVDRAELWIQQAVTQREQLLNSPDLQLAYMLLWIQNAQRRLGKFNVAKQTIERAQSLIEKMLVKQPNDPELLGLFGSSIGDLRRLYAAQSDIEQTNAVYEQGKNFWRDHFRRHVGFGTVHLLYTKNLFVEQAKWLMERGKSHDAVNALIDFLNVLELAEVEIQPVSSTQMLLTTCSCIEKIVQYFDAGNDIPPDGFHLNIDNEEWQIPSTAERFSAEVAESAWIRMIEVANKSGKPQAIHWAAWVRATSYDDEIRNPAEALALARKAVQLAPDEPTYLGTLAVAQYRCGMFQESEQTLQAFLEAKKEQDKEVDTGHMAFLAMVSWQVHNHYDAHFWFDAFRADAETTLNLDPTLRGLLEECQTLLTSSGQYSRVLPAN